MRGNPTTYLRTGVRAKHSAASGYNNRIERILINLCRKARVKRYSSVAGESIAGTRYRRRAIARFLPTAVVYTVCVRECLKRTDNVDCCDAVISKDGNPSGHCFERQPSTRQKGTCAT